MIAMVRIAKGVQLPLVGWLGFQSLGFEWEKERCLVVWLITSNSHGSVIVKGEHSETFISQKSTTTATNDDGKPVKTNTT
jgi:hypothetical protein